MSHPIFASELFIVLSDEQQELLTAGADFELSNSNFANKNVFLQGTTFSGPQGSSANSQASKNALSTAAQDLLGLGGTIPPGIRGLGNVPYYKRTSSGATTPPSAR